jgi:hypothetical protein
VRGFFLLFVNSPMLSFVHYYYSDGIAIEVMGSNPAIKELLKRSFVVHMYVGR